MGLIDDLKTCPRIDRMRVLGLMSGTSADGVDAVLAHFEGPPTHPRWHLLRNASLAYPAELHRRIVSAGQGHPHSAAALLDLAEDITEHQAPPPGPVIPTARQQWRDAMDKPLASPSQNGKR